MKNKSIGSLILLAILAPSCGSGGGGGGSKRSITKPRWEEMYRKPTGVDLRAVRFGSTNSGLVAGKLGTFVRTDTGGTSWSQLEHTPQTLTGDVLSMAVGGTATVAVGSNPSGGSVAWGSVDATTFTAADSLPTAFSEPWVDVSMTVGGSSASPAGTVRLRPTGFVDAYQGSLLLTVPSTRNDAPAADTPWTTATGIVALGTSGTWFVCGDNAGVGQIRKTTNDGTFFTTCPVPATPALRRMSFVDATHGYACGDGNTILTTVDGNTWTVLPGNPGGLPAGNLRGISFFNNTLGFAVGDGGRIYRLRFASSAWTWQVQASPTGEDLYDVTFGDVNTVYAVGNNGVVVKSSNAAATSGVTWSVMSQPSSNPTPVFNAIDFTRDGAVGLAVGNGGTVVRSLNAGATWTPFNTGISGNVTAVSIPRTGSGTVAFVGTDAGAMFVNADLQGSGSWSGPTTGTFPANAIKAILFPNDDGAGIATGAAGKFAVLSYTILGGLTVAPQTLAPAQAGTNYAAAADPAGTTLYIGGDNGYLVQSTNGGANWTAVAPAPPVLSIRALQVPDGPAFKMFIGASDDKVYRLPAGGLLPWAATNTTSFGTPAGLAFVNDTTGWVVTQGASGGVFYTTDSGTLWIQSLLHVPVDATAAHTLNGIWMSGDGATGFVVGGNGVLMRTTTGGQ